MDKTPSRARFVSYLLADNMRILRNIRGLSQQELAERMSSLGHEWSRQTVSQIENRARSTIVDELVGLVVCLETSLSRLLDPRPFDMRHDRPLPEEERLRPIVMDAFIDLIEGGEVIRASWSGNARLWQMVVEVQGRNHTERVIDSE